MHSWVYIHIMHMYKHIYFHQHNKKNLSSVSFTQAIHLITTRKKQERYQSKNVPLCLKILKIWSLRNLKISVLGNFSLSSGLLLWHCSRLCKVYLGHSTCPKSVPVLHIHLKTPFAYTILHFSPFSCVLCF